MFIPWRPNILPPRGQAVFAAPLAGQETASPVSNVAVPIPTTVDLQLIPASNEREFFIWQPFQGSINRVYISAEEDRTFTSAETFQIVQRNGGSFSELTNPVHFPTIGLEPVQINNIATALDGPVYLKVSMTARDQLLFVTLEAIISEIP